ncbi:very-long-chain 3-oxoacyl-CoA reductase 1 [Canna indica]|uniref:Very-long-chain 3-oxoacyl-CoA reductase 1 n=1 Tax=Canna indica TaxID=4628 RepID=A0AAQ3K9R1_9LILI|nr:very-long-chain 3-oxoacyl-CoA reductase 1 [Canna indica]
MEQFSSFVALLSAQPSWLIFLSSLGLLNLLRAAAVVLAFLHCTFLRPPRDLKSYGSWAVVTGATDGIGKAIAFELARRGLNLVIVGRNPAKLKQLADDIGGAAVVKPVVVDLAADDLAAAVGRLEAEVADLDVGVLVNCAGTTYAHAMYFHEAQEEVWRGIVRVNVEATTRVTRAVLPGMVRRRRGAVVNIGSAASVAVPSFPLSTVYAATKAYVDQFSRSLFMDYKKMGIDVQCQIPFYVATKMVSFKQSSTFIPSPERYAKAAVRRIGYEVRCIPYWSHSLQWWATFFIPDFVLISRILHVGINERNRARGLKEA